MPALPLPLLATAASLGGFVGESIADDNARAKAVLRMASNFVRSYTNVSWGVDGEDVPEAVEDVVLDVASRMWFNPEGLVADAIDDSRRQWSESAAEGMYFTAANKAMLAPLVKNNGSGGLRVISTERGDIRCADTIYVPTGPPPSGDPFPWYSA